MPKTSNRKLFVSYGRRDAQALADVLVEALRENGYEPWQDKRKIRAGTQWEEEIKQGLRDSGACVAVLSPHSVRTRGATEMGGQDQGDSVCLKEICYAESLKKPIVPTMAPPGCEPPLTIFHLDYVDLTRWEESPDERQQGITRLLEGIRAALEGEIRYRSWVDQLRPMDFGAFLRDKRENFVGRTWLFEELDRWCRESTESTLLIVGDPGIGKSAIVAELVIRNPGSRVLAYHCCQEDTPDTLDPGRFVRNIAAMIASRIPEYAERLEAPGLRERLNEAACEKDPESAFEIGVLDALAKLPAPSDGCRVLVVDALDEALLRRDASAVSIVTLLRTRLRRFPPWLKLIATTRDEEPVLEALSGFRADILDAGDPRNLKDVSDYVAGRLASDLLVQKLAASKRMPERVTKRLTDLADGNFLYVQQALDALESPQTTLEDLDTLPPLLAGQYAWFFERQFKDEAAFRPMEALLEVIVVGQRAMDEEELALLSGLDEDDELPKYLRLLSAYLRKEHVEDTLRYRVYHRSISDWLTKRERRCALHTVSRKKGHKRVADHLWMSYEAAPTELVEYGLVHLATHLAELARHAKPAERHAWSERLLRFVLDPKIQELRQEDPHGMHRSLLLALEVISGDEDQRSLGRVLRIASGLEVFRHQRLDPRRLFELARRGELDSVQKEIELYPVESPWREASLLVAAWLAVPEAADAARTLRDRIGPSLGCPRLIERIDTATGGPPSAPPNLPNAPSPPEVEAIMTQIKATDLEAFSGLAEGMVDPHDLPPPDVVSDPNLLDDEAPALLAQIHADPLVAYALALPAEGTRALEEYVGLHAANSYRTYRNRSLWPIFCAALEHPDDTWVLELLPKLCTAALAGGNPEFVESVSIALDGFAADQPADPTLRVAFVAKTKTTGDAARALGGSGRGEGDSWGSHRRRLAAYAESLAYLLGDEAQAHELITIGLDAPYGYAGFNAPACLTVAESARVAKADPSLVMRALDQAQGAAHNVQDPTFCARTTSRVNALRRLWWLESAGEIGRIDNIADIVDRFVENPQASEFVALHVIGWEYHDRGDMRGTQRLPGWVRDARCLRDLALVYQQPVASFFDVNSGIDDSEFPLADGTLVQVPDPAFAPLLAARFAAELLLSPDVKGSVRARVLQRLVPIAAANETALDTVLARLLLAARPGDAGLFLEISKEHATYLNLRSVF